jgi:hypothetical protein
MTSNSYADQIIILFKLLLRTHKTLLDFQKATLESLEQKQYSPYDMLQMAINHPEFEWLRQVSTLMADMDDRTSDKKNPANAEDLNKFIHRLNEIFDEAAPETQFKTRLNVALEKSAVLRLEVAALRTILSKSLKM